MRECTIGGTKLRMPEAKQLFPNQKSVAEDVFDYLIDRGYEDEMNVIADGFVDIVQIAGISFGQKDGPDAGAMGCEYFFADTADRQYIAAQGDFAGHGEFGGDGDVFEQDEQGTEDGASGRRAVFWCGTGGNVYMDIEIGEHVRIEVERFGMGSNQGHGGTGAFLHDVAEFSGDGEIAFARHLSRFDEENVTADGSPGQSGGYARESVGFDHVEIESFFAQESFEIPG